MHKDKEQLPVKCEPVCRSCNKELGQELAVTCAKCRSAHHRNCWDKKGHCSLPSCDSSLFEVPSPRQQISADDDGALILVQPVFLQPKFVRTRGWLQGLTCCSLIIPSILATFLFSALAAFSCQYLFMVAVSGQGVSSEDLPSWLVSIPPFIGILLPPIIVTQLSGLFIQRRITIPIEGGVVTSQLCFLRRAIPLLRWQLFHTDDIVDLVMLQDKKKDGGLHEELFVRLGEDKFLELFVQPEYNIKLATLQQIGQAVAQVTKKTIVLAQDPQDLNALPARAQLPEQIEQARTRTNSSRCPVCGSIGDELTVSCAKCEVPHHESCFRFNGGCAVYGCCSVIYQQRSTSENAETKASDLTKAIKETKDIELSEDETIEVFGPLPQKLITYMLLLPLGFSTLLLFMAAPSETDSDLIKLVFNLGPWVIIAVVFLEVKFIIPKIRCLYTFDTKTKLVTQVLQFNKKPLRQIAEPFPAHEIATVAVRRGNVLTGEQLEFLEITLRDKSILNIRPASLDPSQRDPQDLDTVAQKIARFANTSVQLLQLGETAQLPEKQSKE